MNAQGEMFFDVLHWGLRRSPAIQGRANRASASWGTTGARTA